MTEKELKSLRQFTSHLLVDYGFEFLPHDPVLPALYIIHKELHSATEKNKLVAIAIQKAVEKTNPSIYNFNAPGESWKFQVAGSLRWFFIGLSLMGSIWLCSVWWRQYNDVRNAENIIHSSSPIAVKLFQQIQEDKEGYLYLQFSLSDGKTVKFYSEYEQAKANKVRVYIGKKN